MPARDGLPAVDRTWSIASPPTEARELEFHIRNVPGGRGTDGWVFGGLALGDTVSVSGPYGRFVLKTDDDRHAILVGGGTGLAPLKSMIRYALEDAAYDGRLDPLPGCAHARVALRRRVLPFSRNASTPTSSPTAPACRRRPPRTAAMTRRLSASAW